MMGRVDLFVDEYFWTRQVVPLIIRVEKKITNRSS